MAGPAADRGDVLIVDDNPKHLDLLGAVLREHGYKVRAALDGPRALKAARSAAPEIIILDVNMPQMDGFSVCKELKADAALCDVPVLFVSAADETLDKVTAFQVGAADYVTKPFQFPEVLSRVEVHLHRARLLRELSLSNQELSRQTARAEEANNAKSRFLASVSLKSRLTSGR